MGLGVIGSGEAARVLARIGFKSGGLEPTRASDRGRRDVSRRQDLDAFLARTEILVCLLPLTSETRGILNRRLFRKLKAQTARRAAPS